MSAENWLCTCGTWNAATGPDCVVCSAARPAGPKPKGPWVCSGCETVNGKAQQACMVCGELFRPGSAAPPKPPQGKAAAATPKPGPKPKADSRREPKSKRPGPTWTCGHCSTRNADDARACVVCGHARGSAPAAERRTERPAGVAKPRRPVAPESPTVHLRDPLGGSKASFVAGTASTATTPPRSEPATPSPRGDAVGSGSPTSLYHPSPGSTVTAERSVGYRAPARKHRGGRFAGIAVVVVLAVAGAAAFVLTHRAPPAAASSGSPSAAPPGCPDRIAEKIPEGQGATLVAAYSTANKKVVLCRTAAGALWYYGEFTADPSGGTVMHARTSPDGYTADNGPYRYVISGTYVTVLKNGSEIGHEQLTPEATPS